MTYSISASEGEEVLDCLRLRERERERERVHECGYVARVPKDAKSPKVLVRGSSMWKDSFPHIVTSAPCCSVVFLALR